MCEHFIARAAEPFRLDELWPFAERLERYGLAGLRLGSGLGRRGRTARVVPRHPRLPRRPGARGGRADETTAALVHLRRPSKLSTLTLADTQPFDDPAGRFAFSHNGDLRDYRALRTAYRDAGPDPRPGRHRGRRALARGRVAPGRAGRGSPGRPPRPVRWAGQPRDPGVATASAHHYAGNAENPVFAFRLGPIGVVSTGIYSLDRSLFRFVAPGATERRLVRPRHDRRARPSRERDNGVIRCAGGGVTRRTRLEVEAHDRPERHQRRRTTGRRCPPVRMAGP